ncbi:MAG: restriction endonuclease [Gemmatimonadota bacterium]|nr:restriction endonuclease [Gemmatimonadota bacterium]
MTTEVFLATARRRFHDAVLASVLRVNPKGVPNNADKDSRISVRLAEGILDRLAGQAVAGKISGQRAGKEFELACKEYLEYTFPRLAHLRPGRWRIRVGGRGRMAIADYDQYEHLAALDQAAKEDPRLAASLGSDYLIKPDVVVMRLPTSDGTINADGPLVDSMQARHTPFRQVNRRLPTLHASVSCKWTLRSDRAQNARSEALNLVRNRKGRLPHIAVVTGEPTPNRIASIALGTGDIDCVYHFALPELEETINDLGLTKLSETLGTMTQGRRLRDISDLPLDLVI